MRACGSMEWRIRVREIGVLFYSYWWVIVVKKEVMSKSTASISSSCVTVFDVTASSGDVVA